MDEEELAALRAKRREARKEMERERRKAVKAAYKRLRDAKKKPEDVRKLFDFPFLSFFLLFEKRIQYIKFIIEQILSDLLC
jgi:hypothetical protein